VDILAVIKQLCTAKKTLLKLGIAWNLFISGLHNSVPRPEKYFPGHRLEIL
jgi:hypothetical protein